jgi:hypothetical protein
MPDQSSYATSYKHLAIVHGIGDQVPNETSLIFMNSFLRALPTGPGYELQVDNLIGSLTLPGKAEETAGGPESPKRFEPSVAVFTDHLNKRKAVIGFSEAYWQDITTGYIEANKGAPPIPIFVWANSINTRLLRDGRRFYTVRDAIDNLDAILKNVAQLATIFKQSATFLKIVNQFLGDVQMYTESAEVRAQINARFADTLQRVPKSYLDIVSKHLAEAWPPPEIYVVAHSEGTVVAYESLVKAAREEDNPWFRHVKGLVTLGSPLDKHFTIWNNCFKLHRYAGPPLEEKIRWFNYWDVSDPVGYSLHALHPERSDTDAGKLFTVRYDSGFARYAIPGLAHVQYWTDDGIQENIIDQVMGLGTTRADTTVKSRWFGAKGIQSGAAWGAYCLLRAITVALLFYFACHLLSWLPNTHPLEWLDQAPLPWKFANDAFWLAAPLLAGKALWELFARNTGWLGKAGLWLRDIDAALWMAALAGLAWNRSGGEPLQVKDLIGYLTGLVTTGLLWRIHTRVHKGLFQMWRYTRGD